MSERTVFPGSASAGRWILFEFEESEDLEWRHFESAAAVNDFVRRDPGREPVVVPEAAMTQHDASRVRERAASDVARATEDLRRYRVASELERKQKDALLRDATASRVSRDQSALDRARDALLEATAPPPAPPAPSADEARAALQRSHDALEAENPLVKARLRPKEEEDGKFWMPWEEFVAIFDNVNICDRTTTNDLRLHVNEDYGVCGIVWGCISGCMSFFCLCRGCLTLYFGHRSTDELRSAKRGCCGCV